MKNFLGLLAVVFVSILSNLAWADKAGNGGSGVAAGGALYVLDLVEAGVESHPFFDSSVRPDPVLTARIQKALANVPNVPAALISQKLTEISLKYDRALPIAIVEGMEMFTWRMLNFKLYPTDDTDGIVEMDSSQNIQLAVRSAGYVKLDEHQWQRLNAANKAALILHEMIYALVYGGDSRDARRITGYLFTNDFIGRGSSGYQAVIGDLLPFGGLKPIREIPVALNKAHELAAKIEIEPVIELEIAIEPGDERAQQKISSESEALQKIDILCHALKAKNDRAEERLSVESRAIYFKLYIWPQSEAHIRWYHQVGGIEDGDGVQSADKIYLRFGPKDQLKNLNDPSVCAALVTRVVQKNLQEMTEFK